MSFTVERTTLLLIVLIYINFKLVAMLQQLPAVCDKIPFLFPVRAKKVSIHGTVYKVKSIVHTGWMDELPEFASISKIVVVGPSSRVYFVLTKYVTKQFATHYHAFEACKPRNESIILLQQSQFKHYLPLHAISLSSVADGLIYIAPRCNVPKC